MHIDLDTVPANMPKSKDFLCSSSFRTAPLGGVNEFSYDATAVLNAPVDDNGDRMVFLWAYPERRMILAKQGVHPVPKACFHEDWNNNTPLIAASASIDTNSLDGAVYRSNKMVMLYWTTKTNYDRMMQNLTEVAEAAKHGRGRFLEERKQIDAYGLSQNYQTQDVMHTEGERVAERQFVPQPKKTRNKVSMPKPKTTAGSAG